jgi:hypothetical protein
MGRVDDDRFEPRTASTWPERVVVSTVIGRRGLGSAEAALGSTTEAVLEAATIPALIVAARRSTDELSSPASDGAGTGATARVSESGE